VITVSDFSADEIEECYHIDCRKIDVIGNSGEHVLRIAPDESILDRLSIRGKCFVLAVATNAKHKNISILSDAAKNLRCDDVPMVLVGSANNKIFDEFRAECATGIVEAGFVSDGELRALYERATCFVFPSIYEGFGIPPLEAMQLGCPVVSSNSAAMPEILGDAALYVAPTDADGFYREIKSLIDNPSLRNVLRERGYARARKYSWAASAERLLAVCSEVAGSGA
jgi:glycosyltransferase involved in cell wall biosynthesis